MGDSNIKVKIIPQRMLMVDVLSEEEGIYLPSATHALAGAGASSFYLALNQQLNLEATLRQLNVTSEYTSFAAQYWMSGIAVASIMGLIPAREAANGMGNNFFETAGSALSVGSEGLVIFSTLAAPLVSLTESGKSYLWIIGRATTTAKYFGAGAGVLFSMGEVVATLEEPGVSDLEIDLSMANAAASIAGIAITFAPANGFPVAGTVVFIVLLGGSYALGTLQAEAKKQRKIVEKGFEFLHKHPKLSADEAKQLNQFLFEHMETQGAFLFMERLIESGDISALRGIPPFIKRTVQRKLFEHLHFAYDQARMFDALLELYAPHEGEEKKMDQQLSQRLKRLSPSTAKELRDILVTQDPRKIAQMKKEDQTQITMGQ